MQIEALEKAWRDQEGAVGLEPVMAFGSKGLMLGAGTVLAAADAGDRSISIDDQAEARLCALLSAAYRKLIPASAVRFIRRGAANWRDGDHAMAAMHLAMTGLPRLHDPKAAAKRLFMADTLMTAGAEPDVILRALDLKGAAAEDTLERYDPQQLCNPSGSGAISGRWAREGTQSGADAAPGAAKPTSTGPAPVRVGPTRPSPRDAAPTPRALTGPASSNTPPQSAAPSKEPGVKPVQLRAAPLRVAPARTAPEVSPVDAEVRSASTIEESVALLEDAKAVGGLASWALRLSAPTVFFGVLLIPSNRMSPDRTAIPGHPSMYLERPLGELLWRFVYKDKGGVLHRVLQQPDGLLRDAEGNVIGRILANGAAAIALPAAKAAIGAKVKEEEPNLCPAPVKDYHGGGPNSVSRAFEDKMKTKVNPDFPTPSGLAYSFFNPDSRNKRVIIDDCQHKTGILFEAKGPTYAKLLRDKLRQFARTKKRNVLNNIDRKLIRQGELQVGASRFQDWRVESPSYDSVTTSLLLIIFRKNFRATIKDWKI